MDDCLVCRAEWNWLDWAEVKVLIKMSGGVWCMVSVLKLLEHRILFIWVLCTKLVLFTRLYKGARSTKHKIMGRSVSTLVWKVYIVKQLFGISLVFLVFVWYLSVPVVNEHLDGVYFEVAICLRNTTHCFHICIPVVVLWMHTNAIKTT
jgi:hypothetical protein